MHNVAFEIFVACMASYCQHTLFPDLYSMPFVLSDTNILEKKITEKNIYDCVNLVLTSVVKPMDYGLWIFALFQLFHTQKNIFLHCAVFM